MKSLVGKSTKRGSSIRRHANPRDQSASPAKKNTRSLGASAGWSFVMHVKEASIGRIPSRDGKDLLQGFAPTCTMTVSWDDGKMNHVTVGTPSVEDSLRPVWNPPVVLEVAHVPHYAEVKILVLDENIPGKKTDNLVYGELNTTVSKLIATEGWEWVSLSRGKGSKLRNPKIFVQCCYEATEERQKRPWAKVPPRDEGKKGEVADEPAAQALVDKPKRAESIGPMIIKRTVSGPQYVHRSRSEDKPGPIAQLPSLPAFLPHFIEKNGTLSDRSRARTVKDKSRKTRKRTSSVGAFGVYEGSRGDTTRSVRPSSDDVALTIARPPHLPLKPGGTEGHSHSDSITSQPEEHSSRANASVVIGNQKQQRNVEFQTLFGLASDTLECDYVAGFLWHFVLTGRLYLSNNHICFYTDLYCCVRVMEIVPFSNVEEMEPENDDIIRVVTRGRPFKFFLRGTRDRVLKVARSIWFNHGGRSKQRSEERGDGQVGEEKEVSEDSEVDDLEYDEDEEEENALMRKLSTDSTVGEAGSRPVSLRGLLAVPPPPSSRLVSTESILVYASSDYVGDDFLKSIGKHKILQQYDFPVSVVEFFRRYWSGEDMAASFCEAYHGARRSKELLVGPWTREGGTCRRDVTFKSPIKNRMGPSDCHLTERQRYHLRADMLVIDISATSRGIPYSESFVVEQQWMVREEGAGCMLTVRGGVHWVKKPYLISGTIESNAVKELKESVNHFKRTVEREEQGGGTDFGTPPPQSPALASTAIVASPAHAFTRSLPPEESAPAAPKGGAGGREVLQTGLLVSILLVLMFIVYNLGGLSHRLQVVESSLRA